VRKEEEEKKGKEIPYSLPLHLWYGCLRVLKDENEEGKNQEACSLPIVVFA
jgi:hypothetical protein